MYGEEQCQVPCPLASSCLGSYNVLCGTVPSHWVYTFLKIRHKVYKYNTPTHTNKLHAAVLITAYCLLLAQAGLATLGIPSQKMAAN